MVSSQDKYLAGIVSGQQCLTKGQFDCCLREGLLPMVTQSDPELEGQVSELNRQMVASEMAHQRVVSMLLDTLGEAGIDCLVFKGTALAYSLYDQPWQRTRGDTDLWVREVDVDAACVVLQRLAFDQKISLPGRLAFGECGFDLVDEFGLTHAIDLHWRLNNNWMLTGATDFEEAWRERIALPRLGNHAWTCTPSLALFIACIHRVGHLGYVAYESGEFLRFESDFTLWLYDIHLLSGSLSGADWAEWSGRVIERRFAKFAVSGLERSCELFGTKIPVSVFIDLKGAQGQLDMVPANQRALAGWQSIRALGVLRGSGYLWQQLFPDPAYMRDRYEGSSLPIAYLKRLLSGLVRQVR